MKKFVFVLLIFFSGTVFAADEVPSLTPAEKEIVSTVNKNDAAALSLLEKLVNINSGTNNIEGVHAVGKIIEKEFAALGFTTEWKYPPENMQRAGTLLLTRKGTQGKHLLLIGHLDTVFPKNSPFQHFTREGNLAMGPGVADDKGGVVLILYALKALHANKALDNTSITIALTGDEENSGKPVSISRAPLLQAAVGADIALDFEPSSGIGTAAISRRGIDNWELISTGNEAHSSTLFHRGTGAGAIFELTRVLDTVRDEIAGQQYSTFNPGIIIGGTEAHIDKNTNNAQGYGKNNVVAQTALARGDMRFISKEQQTLIKNHVTEITQKSLPGTTSTVIFEEAIPAMPLTSANMNLLEMYSKVSTDLGFPVVKAVPPDQRGAADISHVATLVKANLAGLGPIGNHTHTENERVDIRSLNINTQRAALLIYRLTNY
jgi:glutamate carboxypeptidase